MKNNKNIYPTNTKRVNLGKIRKIISFTLTLILLAFYVSSYTFMVYSDDDISVEVTIYDSKNKVTRLSDYSLTLASGTNADAIMSALKEQEQIVDYIQNTGVVTSISFKTITLAVQNSTKWIYKINGRVYENKLYEHKLNNKDEIVFEYIQIDVPISSNPAATSTAASHISRNSLNSEANRTNSKTTSERSINSRVISETSETSETSGNLLSEISSSEIESNSSAAESNVNNTNENTASNPIFDWQPDNTNVLDIAIDYLSRNDPGNFYLISTGTAGKGSSPQITETIVNKIRETNGDYIIPTDLERDIIGLAFCGIDPQNMNGINLIEILANFENIETQGANAVAFALIAFDCGDFYVSENAVNSRKNLVQKLLQFQNEDGGFSISDSQQSDIDMTAMSLTALSKYTDDENVAKAISNSMDYLDVKFTKEYKNLSSESISQVIIALTSLNIRISESRFVYDDVDIVKMLEEYQNEDGGFPHLKKDDSNVMSTEQAVLALSGIKNGVNPYKVQISSDENGGNSSDINVIWIILTITGIAILIGGGILFIIKIYRRKA